jgi:hypothetical protein
MEVATINANIWRLRMLNICSCIVAALCGLCLAATSMAAEELMIFPNADQSPEQ